MIWAHEKGPTRKPDPSLKTIEEHAIAHDHRHGIRRTTTDYRVPADGGPEVAFTFAQPKERESDLTGHPRIENEILSPMARETAR